MLGDERPAELGADEAHRLVPPLGGQPEPVAARQVGAADLWHLGDAVAVAEQQAVVEAVAGMTLGAGR